LANPPTDKGLISQPYFYSHLRFLNEIYQTPKDYCFFVYYNISIDSNSQLIYITIIASGNYAARKWRKTMAITKSTTSYDNGNSLNRLTCDDCRAWCWEGQQIRHSKRCDTPNAQWAEPAVAHQASATTAHKPGAFSQDSPASGLTKDEINEALYRREISQSDAMNTDF
jgi:hypothetical protein